MRPETYHMLAGRQGHYWWNRARRVMATALLLRSNALPPGLRLLDLGCGPGGNLGMLAAFHPSLVVGVDLSPLALSLARKTAPSANLIRADISKKLPFSNEIFDIVTIFNVVCSDWVTSEVNVLREAYRTLRPGGFLLITEPAYKSLAREMDIVAMAHRRYRTGDIAAFCRSAGFEPLVASYFTWFGFPVLLALKAAKWIKHRLWGKAGPEHQDVARPAADMKPLPPIINSILYAAAAVEARAIARGLKIPFGTTVVCLARKP
jgi:SAM-dependent methyltransferase